MRQYSAQTRTETVKDDATHGPDLTTNRGCRHACVLIIQLTVPLPLKSWVLGTPPALGRKCDENTRIFKLL